MNSYEYISKLLECLGIVIYTLKNSTIKRMMKFLLVFPITVHKRVSHVRWAFVCNWAGSLISAYLVILQKGLSHTLST